MSVLPGIQTRHLLLKALRQVSYTTCFISMMSLQSHNYPFKCFLCTSLTGHWDTEVIIHDSDVTDEFWLLV